MDINKIKDMKQFLSDLENLDWMIKKCKENIAPVDDYVRLTRMLSPAAQAAIQQLILYEAERVRTEVLHNISEL